MTHGPAPRRNAAEQHRLDSALTTLFEQQIHFNQLLGLNIRNFSGAGVIIKGSGNVVEGVKF